MAKGTLDELVAPPEFKKSGFKELAEKLAVDTDLIDCVGLADSWYHHLASLRGLDSASVAFADLEVLACLCDKPRQEKAAKVFRMQHSVAEDELEAAATRLCDLMKSRYDAIQLQRRKLAEGPSVELVEKG